MIRRLGRAISVNWLVLAAAAVLVLESPRPASAQATALTQQTLLDRVSIEDLMVRYYTLLTAADRHDIGRYFTEDAVLEANGTVLEGRAAIQNLYDTARDPRILPGHTYNMLLGNPRISVDGNEATLDALWTGVLSESITSTPRVLEQGSEHTELVKRGGAWLIARRVIVSQGGLPEEWAAGIPPSLDAGSSAASAPAKAELEEANRRIVVTMYNLLMNDHKVDEALEYIGPNYIQHNVRAPDGKAFLRGAFKARFAEYPNYRSDIKRTVAEGDLVVVHTHERFNPGDPKDLGSAIVDIYRVEDGLIAEHWDAYMPVPPREQWQHDNGMF